MIDQNTQVACDTMNHFVLELRIKEAKKDAMYCFEKKKCSSDASQRTSISCSSRFVIRERISRFVFVNLWVKKLANCS